MQLSSLIAKGARYYSGRPAVSYRGRDLTFSEVYERVCRLSHALMDLGVRPGDKVALLSGNCPQFIEVFLARMLCGAVDITLNPRLSPEDLLWQLYDSEASVLFAGEGYLNSVLEQRHQLPSLKHVVAISGSAPGALLYEELIERGSARPPEVTVDESAVARIGYTTGTTGRPKGVVTTWKSRLAVLRNMLVDLVPDLSASDVFLALQPLYHAPSHFILPCWVRGVRHVIVDDFRPEVAFSAIERYGVTVVKTVPTVLIRLLASPDVRTRNLASLRTIIYGASPMPVEKLREAIELFGPILVQNYGQQEAPMTICCLRKEDHRVEGDASALERLASAGRPYTFVEVKIVDEEGNEVPVGEVGEVAVKGDHVMVGYWKAAAPVEGKLRDGWLLTGDIGRVDEEGYVYLVDRKDEMIVTGGLNVYPNEVEQVLYQHPAVLEAAVFGRPDHQWGEAVHAVVALKPGMHATEEELIEFCKQRLARYKAPKGVEFRDSLPKSASGKILRRVLREAHWQGFERRVH